MGGGIGAAALIARAAALARKPIAPGGPELRALVEAARTVLLGEAAELRPRDSRGRPGGLVRCRGSRPSFYPTSTPDRA